MLEKLLILLLVTPYYFTDPTIQQDRTICNKDNSELECLLSLTKYALTESPENCYLNKIDEKGVSTDFHELLLDVYVADSNLTNSEVVKVVEDVNLIWKDYGIQFTKNSISKVENENLKPTFRNNEDYLKFGRDIVGEDKLHDRVIDVIFVEEIKTSSSKQEGKTVRENNSNFILVSTKSKNVSWIVTHEMGHILNLEDKAYFSGELNLMTHTGCIKDRYYSTILNQKQVGRVTSAAESYERK